MRLFAFIACLSWIAVLSMAAPVNETALDTRDDLEVSDDSETDCMFSDPTGPVGYVPRGSAYYFNIYIKGQDLMQTDEDCSNSALKMRIEQQSACKALTHWRCQYKPETKETYATFLQSIFCTSKPMQTAVEASTSPKIKTSCIHVKDDNAGLGNGVDAAVAGVFNALGGSISRGQH